MVTPSSTTTTRAVAMKIFAVIPNPRARSVPLTRAPRAVILPVLVLVLHELVAGGVHGDLEAVEAARGHRDLLRDLGCALVPDLQRVLAGRDARDGEAAVGAGLRVPAVVAHHDEPRHPGMDVAEHPHQPRPGEALVVAFAAAVEAQVEGVRLV